MKASLWWRSIVAALGMQTPMEPTGRRGSTPNRYKPHQGAKERARRLRRGQVKHNYWWQQILMGGRLGYCNTQPWCIKRGLGKGEGSA